MVQTYFDAAFFSNRDYALSKEYLITSDKGYYSASTLSGCNQRKYHGVFVAPQSAKQEEGHVLVSCINETIISGKESHALSIHSYQELYYPEGDQFIQEFYGTPIPKWVYGIKDIVLFKQILFTEVDDGLLIRYTLEEANEPIVLQVVPLLAFRSVHQLSKMNMAVNKRLAKVKNGIRANLYRGYSNIYLQFSEPIAFVENPDWYYQISYPVEQDRGYDFKEDLFSPGNFSVEMSKGQQLILYIGHRELSPKLFKNHFVTSFRQHITPVKMDDFLQLAARQFIIERNEEVSIKAGYYWFGSWGRDTFIALPGLTLVHGYFKTYKSAVNTMLSDFKDGLFPNVGTGEHAAYNSVDASLWFIWSLQQLAIYAPVKDSLWTDYKSVVESILNHYKNGAGQYIKMDNDGLMNASAPNKVLTWMDSVVEGKPVTPRNGKQVEVNALWYNAVCFSLQLARVAGDDVFVKEWETYPEKISKSFIAVFWSEEKQYLADYADQEYRDWSVRPNQLFAVSLPYSPVSMKQADQIICKVKEELLTPRGLRTLSAKDSAYKGSYSGGVSSRDSAYHQGTVWPWLLAHFAEAYLKIYGHTAIPFIEEIYNGFEEALSEKCLFSIAEIYNGDAPHRAVGAVAQAWSVGELIRMKSVIERYKKNAPEVELINSEL